MARPRLGFLDFTGGFAILAIVAFHELGAYYPYSRRVYLQDLGLGLFTLVSGYRFYYGRSCDGAGSFAGYAKKRFIRLYKPYIGYSLLALPVTLLVYYLIRYSAGIDRLIASIQSPQAWAGFFLGVNFIAPQLWFLVLLLAVNLVAAFAFMRWGVRGLLILAPIMLGAYLLAGLQQPAGLVGEDIGKIIMAIPVYCVVFIMGIIIAMAIDGEEPRKAMWLAPLVVLLAPMGSLLLFTPPVLVFLAICYWRTRKELNRDNYLSRNSFNIYLFHWPLILPLASRAFVFYLGMDNILGYALAIATAILLCPVAYKVAKALRLNRLFE